MSPGVSATLNTYAQAQVNAARTLVCATMPHMAGLAYAVEVFFTDHVPTAAIAASGRMAVNGQWFNRLNAVEAAYIFSHELLHLALGHHERFATTTDAEAANIACDAVINGMLTNIFGIKPPANGINGGWAQNLSAEEVLRWGLQNGYMDELRRQGSWRLWDDIETGIASPMATALSAALKRTVVLTAQGSAWNRHWDLVPAGGESDIFGIGHPEKLRNLRKIIDRIAKECLIVQSLTENSSLSDRGVAAGGHTENFAGLRGCYRPPWDLAVQRWLEETSPSGRSYARASRRDGGRTDVVLPGRSREGSILNIVLDTSGSMAGAISLALGSIQTFADATGLNAIRIIQCDAEVTADEIVSPDQLSDYPVSGFGDSDMSPAMWHLAEDPTVTAVIVITDGGIGFPSEPMPYDVLWAVVSDYSSSFTPPYGRVVSMTPNPGSSS